MNFQNIREQSFNTDGGQCGEGGQDILVSDTEQKLNSAISHCDFEHQSPVTGQISPPPPAPPLKKINHIQHVYTLNNLYLIVGGLATNSDSTIP